ncbi:type I DNA topoisomerase [Acidaminobacter sp.]|uniref:type I DNA topoisomerase n=1 Tax=Acidaminobacter sp. TaxID=1872102 RepID=UPI001385EC9F|nr:type I DNA topoisomerase [Acidaminobacter sp.]MDK9709585.1 type I DNA topoisomerase [Acidaminobacter sp.]MZQ96503.1 type I DNA topoisomerase [Acidaminobacter sp.]
MAKHLIIVESPAKAKTIEKFLGKNYQVLASVGHVRDLPKSKIGVNVEKDFEPEYINIRGKGDVIKVLRGAAKKADRVFLATDPDREGEAIAWHLGTILSIPQEEPCRIEFHEITKEAVKEAIHHPRQIDLNLVDAQQARRVLDRLVGYKISPLLWRKVRKGLSAGRVQSVATKLICDRENEINAFIKEEYWSIGMDLRHVPSDLPFEAELSQFKGKKIEIGNETDALEMKRYLESVDPVITEVQNKVKSRAPQPPFTTSSLQQDAANRLGFSASKTMMVAQQLYEGIAVKGQGTIGLITYMRTDSTRISEEAKRHLSEFIDREYGEIYQNKKVRTEKKSKSAQDAHEAVRPTYVHLTPEELEASLTKDQQKLYTLIWQRFVASGMSDATFDSKNVSIVAGEALLKANGLLLKFDGFLKVYEFSSFKETRLPDIQAGDLVQRLHVKPEQHFTQPPARYTEATLVKEMEEKGIGRPSTYAPTIATIISRGYVEREKKSLKPTELGYIINDIMAGYFEEIVNVDFTAGMENKLDEVEAGNMEWHSILREFYGPFSETLAKADERLEKLDLTEKTDLLCEKCGHPLNIKHGRFGKFYACSNYPQCDYTKAILNEIGIDCPVCKEGKVVERKTKKLKTFYGCSRFPECRFVSWNRPVGRPCPVCGEALVEKITKKNKTILCSSTSCNYKEVSSH